MSADPPAAVLAGVPTRRRWLVFAVVVALNFGVWLDEAKMAQLSPFWSASLGLDAVRMASVLSAYLIGYAPMLAVAGVLADRFGPRRILIVCGVGVTVLSVSMVYVRTYEEMWWRNLVFGLVFGLLLAPSFRLLATWFPAHERPTVTSLNTGACAGLASIVTPLIALPIAHHISWQIAFVVVAVFTVPPLVALLLISDQPRQMRGINQAEIDLIGGDDAAREVTFKEMLGLARNKYVLIFGISGLLISPIWLALNWLSYGLLTLDRVDPDVATFVLPAITAVPVVFSFFNGQLLLRAFKGRARLLIASGFVLGGAGFLLATVTSNWVVWALLVGGVVGVSNLMYFGTMNVYWAELVGPQFCGVLTGVTSCLQVSVGVYLVSASGTWINSGAVGHAQLNPIMIVGGLVMLVAVVPVLLAREVHVRRLGPPETTGTPQDALDRLELGR